MRFAEIDAWVLWCYNASGIFGFPAGRKQMALGFSPLNTKVEGGEIMSDFEIISVVIMVASRRCASNL